MSHLKQAAVQIRFIALVAYAVSLPFGQKFPSIVNNMSVVLLSVAWALELEPRKKISRLLDQKLLWLLAALYGVYIAGMLYTENAREGRFELEKKMSLLFVPLLLATGRPLQLKHIRQVAMVFIGSCIAATAVCFAHAVALNYRQGQTLSYLYNAVVHDVHVEGYYDYLNYWYFTYKLFALAVQMHPVYLAMYIVFSGCLAVWLWWDGTWRHRWRNVAIVCLLMYFFLVVVLLSSRTQLFCMAVFGLTFAFYNGWRNRVLLPTFAVLAITGGIGLFVILKNPVIRERIISSNKPGAHYTQNVYGEGGLSLRMLKWKYAQEAIREAPLLGVGTGDGQDKLQEVYARHQFAIGFENRFNPHNQFLQTWLETGIAGVCVLLACLLVPLWRATHEGMWIYVAFLALFIVSCTTESMLQVNKGIAFYAFFNALFCFRNRETGNASFETHSGKE